MAATDLLSKMVMQRKRLGRGLCGALEKSRSTVAAGLRERLARHLEAGEAMPDVDLFVRLLERSVASHVERLDRAENAHFHEMVEVKRLRRERDRAAKALYRPLVEVRRAAVGIYGAEIAAEVLNVEGRTQRSAWMLAEQAGLVVYTLSRHSLPPAKAGGMKVLAEEWLALLRPPLERLKAILEKADPEKLAGAATREEKRRAITAFDEALDLSLRGLLLLHELAGEASEAERLRRVFRRPHRFRHPAEPVRDAAAWWRRARGWLGRVAGGRTGTRKSA